MKRDAILSQVEFLKKTSKKSIKNKIMVTTNFKRRINKMDLFSASLEGKANQREKKYSQQKRVTNKKYLALFVDICKHLHSSTVILINVFLCKKNASIVINSFLRPS
jgi:hypothetical protein